MIKTTLYSQIISVIHRSSFNKIVKHHHSKKPQKGYDRWTQLVAMLFCQFAKSQSVREITNGLCPTQTILSIWG
ncbi:MAG TPA: DUF4372 domain-containing protein [Niabella sp.]|nr:DUF4372 domain-containing protein [Chitinophagaceae bacterium]HRN46481.1 DUF4372 domain-containing protein [Niabella sp.]HRO85276.1 DUF4372 domain-containing protein [Niabella sp.]HUN02849.1 DUF4372 domain-containing protein [Niabella sp.]